MADLYYYLNYDEADLTIKVNELNQFLQNYNNKIVDNFNYTTEEPAPVSYLRWTLSLIGAKEGYSFGNTFLSLTQEIDQSYQAPDEQNNDALSSTVDQPDLIFGTGIALHETNFNEINDNGRTVNQRFADYSYTAAMSLPRLPSVAFGLNDSATGYSPSLDITLTGTETFSTYMTSLIGREVAGGYPHKLVFAGSPKGLYNALVSIEKTKGPYQSFDDFSTTLSEVLEEVQFPPAMQDGLQFGLGGSLPYKGSTISSTPTTSNPSIPEAAAAK